MCNQIRLCYDCLWPICFPWGEKMHIGTGWYCWNEHHDDDEIDVPAFLSPFEFLTNSEALAGYVGKAVDLYAKWKGNNKQQAIFVALRGHLRKRRSDVLHNFLKSVHKDKEIGRFLRQLTLSDEWQRWAHRARARAAKATKVQRKMR